MLSIQRRLTQSSTTSPSATSTPPLQFLDDTIGGICKRSYSLPVLNHHCARDINITGKCSQPSTLSIAYFLFIIQHVNQVILKFTVGTGTASRYQKFCIVTILALGDPGKEFDATTVQSIFTIIFHLPLLFSATCFK